MRMESYDDCTSSSSSSSSSSSLKRGKRRTRNVFSSFNNISNNNSLFLSLFHLIFCMIVLTVINHGNMNGINAITNNNEQQQQQDPKLLQMMNLSKQSLKQGRHGVITLDDKNFNYLALSKHKTYNIIAFFTATASKYGCDKCRDAEKEFNLVTEAYWSAKTKEDNNNDKNNDNTFFIRLDFDTSSNVFKNYGFKGVPVILYISSLNEKYQINNRDRMGMGSMITAEDITDFVKLSIPQITSFVIYRSPYPIIILLSFLLACLAISAKYVIQFIPYILEKIRNKKLWIFISLFLYTCSIAGMVYDIIRSPPPFHMDHRGQMIFFHPQSGQQFVVEGFVIGFLNLFCALSMVLLVRWAPHIKYSNVRDSVVGILAILAFMFFWSVKYFYTMKNPWYMRQR